MEIRGVKTAITIVGFTRSYPDQTTILDFDGSYKRLGVGSESTLSADLEIKVESDDGRTTTHLADLDITCPQETQLASLLKWAVKQHGLSEKPESRPQPNYYGRKLSRVISYDKDTPKAIVEVENPGGGRGQWCVLFSALDLCTQRWILNEVWKKRSEGAEE